MANFNITSIRPPNYLYSSAFDAIRSYLQFYMNRLGHNVIVTDNTICPASCNIVFGAHLGGRSLSLPPGRTIIFNTETLPLPEGQWGGAASAAYGELLRRYPVWDYASANVTRGDSTSHVVIPLLYCPIFKRGAYAVAPTNELVFYGHLTRRRRSILEDVARKGLPVRLIVDAFGPVRDRAIVGARAVLNLHKHERVGILEAVRCFHALCLSAPVISEEVYPDAAQAALIDAIFVCAGDRFADAVAGLLENDRAFADRKDAAIERFFRTDPMPGIAAAIDASLRAMPR